MRTVVVAQGRVAVARIRRVPIGVPALVPGPDPAVEDHILHLQRPGVGGGPVRDPPAQRPALGARVADEHVQGPAPRMVASWHRSGGPPSPDGVDVEAAGHQPVQALGGRRQALVARRARAGRAVLVLMKDGRPLPATGTIGCGLRGAATGRLLALMVPRILVDCRRLAWRTWREAILRSRARLAAARTAGSARTRRERA